ncbi:M23 family metallopeptidase [Rhodospirillum rubrum]|uniref:Peptidase M23B n=1 Tax=Rhodospirillum rubrum (strain ATCC 11170 / ATH 1.1.1 / DSM 467 / LMG 4362 / NCIMB 8255 / S1) TaxID=269796 RepID=Q2RTT5_RHORT|nr:M23 family metallopeptidase [Rhodospirillum rubrum]ABC22460.1 Peptidase M23B [Rhodospirillum rubrum ATCC 11170]AEO48177.1 peptidase M23B [Rhodospirillum rubrum F11]MBK5954042.1 peptidase M23 [Rhodospirillum rubrum]QXG82092.1 M23 family metallopeptidase [Rhodospirillum rubrum]HCF18053.1 M23 family peptidase [Rhodospirillum rubrum]
MAERYKGGRGASRHRLAMGVWAVLAGALIVVGWPWSALADGPPRLGLPIDCSPGRTCWITSYVDTDPGPEARDQACGIVTYNGHDGTDFGIGTMTEQTDVAVLAAAAGTVLRIRDGMADINRRLPEAASVEGRECGNGVVLDHGDGWTTQYCHLRKGSIAVKAGQKIPVGQRLGAVGLSGNTEHPHLHMTVRRGTTVFDPFKGRSAAQGCKGGALPLWSPVAMAALHYQPIVLYNVGFAGEEPDRLRVRAGGYGQTIAAKAPMLVAYADIIGVAKNDRLRLEIIGPDGRPFARSDRVFDEKGWVQWFGYAGKRLASGEWAKGVYTAIVTVDRPGKGVIGLRDSRATVR